MGKNFKNINEELERIKTLMFETDSLILNERKPLNEQTSDITEEEVIDEEVTDEQITGTETGDKFKTVRSSFKLAKVSDVNTLLRGGAAKFDTYKVKGTGVISLFDKDGKMTPEGIELMKKSGLKLPAGQIVMRIGKVDDPNTDKVFFQVIPAKELSIVTQSGDIKNVDPKELEKLPTVQDLKPSEPVTPFKGKGVTDEPFSETKDFLIGKKIDELTKQYNLKITDMTPQFKEQGWTAAAYYKRNDDTKTVYGVNKDGIILSFFKRVKGAPKKGVSENFNMDLVFVNPLLFESVVSEQDTKTVETENDYYIKMDGSGKETKMSDKFTQVVDGTYKGTPGGDKKKTGGGGKKTGGGDTTTTTKTDWSAYPCVTKKSGYKKVKTDKGESYQSQGDRLWNYYADGTYTTKDSSGKIVESGTYKCEGDTIKTTVKGGGAKPKTAVVLTDKDLMGETGVISNLMNSSVPTIVSLVTPLSIPLKILSLGVSALAKVTRRTGVKGVVDALDGFVTADDLAYVLTVLKSLNGKQYFDAETNKNIPATRRFLELYSEDEGGDDLIADVRSVGTRTLPTGSEKLKSMIIRTATAQSGGVS